MNPEQDKEHIASNLDAKYEAIDAALDEELKLLREMKQLLAKADDRLAAEEIILEKYAPIFERHASESSRLITEWLASLRAARGNP